MSIEFFCMSDPLVHAFFVGRAIADLLYEQLEHSLTDALSELVAKHIADGVDGEVAFGGTTDELTDSDAVRSLYLGG